jgi:PAS domain S-box-containing protein
MNTAPFFKHYYNNAQVNCIMIMDAHGVILDVNSAFTNNFGYSNEDLRGKNFSELFIQSARENNIPELEIEAVLSKGQAHDENYVVDKQGNAIWCTGEAILIEGEDGRYIVKDVLNLQAKKQVQLFMKGTEELLQRILQSSNDIPMLVLNGSMKVEKVNSAFLKLFEIEETPLPGSRLSELQHPFWGSESIKNEVRNILVNNEHLKHKEFSIDTKSGHQKKIMLDSRIIDNQPGKGREVFIIMEEVTVA